jgi:hypothetical protein
LAVNKTEAVMFKFALAAAVLLAATSAHAAKLAPPIAQAASGAMQCYAPNTTRKTCASLAGYTLNADGGIDNLAIVLISNSPVVVMRTTAPVVIKDGRVCGPIRAEDLQASTFVIEGQPADEATTAQARQQVMGAMKAMVGKEVCTAYIPDGAEFAAKATLDGVAQPAMDQRVIWVSPSDGYTVAP